MRGIQIGGALLLGTGLALAQSPAASTLEANRALVSKYCAGCHNDKLKSGGFTWTSVDLAHPEKNAEQVEKISRKLHAGMMPPAGSPRPDQASLKALATFLEQGVDKVAIARVNPGTPDLHRLNRTEYRNTVRDLLGLDVDVKALLPPDDMSHGFDNMADALTITPALMQGYLRAAGKISRLAVGDAQADPVMAKYDVPKVANQMRHVDGAPSGTRGGISVIHNFPADGEYTLKGTLYYYYTEELYGRALPGPLQGQELEISIDGEPVGVFTIDPSVPERNANFITPKIHVTAGPKRVSAAFISKFDGPILDQDRLVEQALVDVSIGLDPGRTTLPHLHSLYITGPFTTTGVTDTPSREKIFSCRPIAASDEIPCARKIISTLARQAYRRPVTDGDVEQLLNSYQFGRNEGNFETGIRMVVQAILADPQFVFRFEQAPANVAPGKTYRISDLELASRLAYFLWSSAPDETLIQLASQGKLKSASVLEQQVRRMLADPRSEALSTNFAHQWLHLQNVKEADPDGMLFGDFTRQLGEAMTRETELLFDNIVHQDRDIKELLTADYTFVNEVLAKHYGVQKVLGTRFQRVPVTDPNRQGILGHGSVLTLTSLANRTSPVARGKYVMEVILGVPPPTPPPNVPPLKENTDRNEKNLSVRERMEEHRANEPCHSCHQMMDPIGLALENFDAIGSWRINDTGNRIDATGELYDGTKLNGPVSLREAVLKYSDSFVRNFAESLMAYGVGRVLTYEDMPMVRSIEQSAAKNGNRFSAFVLGVVKSPAFQMRVARPMTSPASESARR